MKRQMIAALLAPVLLLFLNACATANGAAQCNGDGSMCWVHDAASGHPDDGILVTGEGCKEICEVSDACANGRVDAKVKYSPPPPTESSVEVSRDDVQAMCIEQP